ncbi:hypothetical protein AGMMS50229_04330 [Campylobacterota bacterium]|nr:hypothetical protein AGMMS50229_04330 [Campylobacterota bacterium]
MIVSFCAGRVRLRFAQLRNRAVADEVLKRILAVSGITNAAINTLTGSLLIEYDQSILPAKELLELGRTELATHGIELKMPKVN